MYTLINISDPIIYTQVNSGVQIIKKILFFKQSVQFFIVLLGNMYRMHFISKLILW